MIVTVVPDVCKGKDAQFEGEIKIATPSFDQRWQYIEDAGIELDEKGQVNMSAGNISALRKMVKATEKHYKEVKIVGKDGVSYKSFSDLAQDPVCDSILFEIAGLFLKGIRPSPN